MGASKKKTRYGETLHDEIGFWSEIKLDILSKYWPEYTKIVKKQSHNFYTIYIDAFAGSGQHVSKTTGEFIKGSPARALDVSPKFDEYHFVDLDEAKVKSLEALSQSHGNVKVHRGDCNKILLNEVLPLVDYKQFRRGLTLLDPYSLQLDWQVIARAAEMKSIEIFLNFPIMDINRNVLHARASENKKLQMTRFWGDDSWESAAYQIVPGLFETTTEKVENDDLIKAFRDRLKKVAGFQFVPKPLAMRNSMHSIVYYLLFAGPNGTGSKIVDWIFEDYRKKGYG